MPTPPSLVVTITGPLPVAVGVVILMRDGVKYSRLAQTEIPATVTSVEKHHHPKLDKRHSNAHYL